MQNIVAFKFSIGDNVITKLGEGKIRQCIINDKEEKIYLVNFNWIHEEEFKEEDIEIIFHSDITKLDKVFDKINDKEEAIDFIKNNFTEEEFNILLEIPTQLKKYYNDIREISISLNKDPECYEKNIKVSMGCRDSRDQMLYNGEKFDEEFWYEAMDSVYNIYVPRYVTRG